MSNLIGPNARRTFSRLLAQTGTPRKPFILKKYKTKYSGNLKKKVNQLTKLVKGTYSLAYLQNRGTNTMASPYFAINCISWPNFRQVFGTGASDWVDENNFILKKMQLDMILRINNEGSNVDYSMFIVTLKNSMSDVYNRTTGALNLIEGTHYARNDVGDAKEGSVFLNPQCFYIKYQRRITIGNNGNTPASTSAPGSGLAINKRITKTIIVNQTYNNPAGNVSALSCSVVPSKQYYIIFFNNNLSIDGENNTVDWNIMNTIKVSD